MSDSRSAAILNIFMGMLDKAAEAPPPKQSGLDGRKAVLALKSLNEVE